MQQRQFKRERISLYLTDSGIKGNLVRSAKLVRLFNRALDCFNKNLFKSGSINEIEFSLTLCGISKIRGLNRVHRGKDKATDVLSFPIHESIDAVKEICGPVLNLGDIFVCKEVALRQSNEFNIGFEEEIIHLLVHGLLHLCGFDHEVSDSEAKKMFDLEEQLIKDM